MQRFAESLRRNTKPDKYSRDSSDMPAFILMYPTDQNEIESTIKHLKSGKAPGKDKIRRDTFKNVASEIGHPLSTFINKIFQNGVCPTAFNSPQNSNTNQHLRKQNKNTT